MRNFEIKNNESGRSMIEMLGVLAIIGVLSVGGIAGYSKAMMKYRINKSIEQISLISQNVRSFFASQRNYGGLDSAHSNGLSLIKKAKLIPDEMIDDDNSIEDNDRGVIHHIFNPFGGGVAVWNDNEGSTVEDCGNDAQCLETIKYFKIIYLRLPQEACVELATQDWGGSAMGLQNMQVFNHEATDIPDEHAACIDDPTGTITDEYIEACPNGTTVPIPVPLDIAVDACNCPNDNCTIMWLFK